MNIYVSLSLFSLIILLYWVISELFTVFFRLAGLPAERARFQVISLLTGCGFTTKESELMLTSKSRRRLARVTMLFGYVFNITIVSAIINIFFSANDDTTKVSSILIGILIPLGTIAVILIVMRLPGVRKLSDKLMGRLSKSLNQYNEKRNPVILLDYIGKDSIATVLLTRVPEEYLGRTLAESRLRSETGILVMLIERPGKKPAAADADTVFEVGDKLTVFGDFKTICKVFHGSEHFADN